MSKLRLLGASCLTAAAVFASPAAWAQSAPAGSVSLDEVIVTAQRKTEKLQDVPISITAVTSDTLTKSGVQSFRDLQTLAPAFKVSNSGVFVQVAIRGITSTALGPGIENNVAVYVDGFYQPDSTSLGGDFANIRDVQILKGPQGTLYGRNATGGALLINTMEPNDERMIVDASAMYGNLDDKRLRAYVGLPIAKGLSIGLGAYSRRNDGYIKTVSGDDGAPYKNDEYRFKIKYEPSSNVSFILGYNSLFKSDPTALAYSMQTNVSPFLPPLGPLRTNKVGVISMSPLPQFKVELHETTLKSQFSSALGTLTSYTSYADEVTFFDNDYDATGIPILEIPAKLNRHTFIEAVDFHMTPSDSLDVTVGGLYFRDNSNIPTDLYSGGALAYSTNTIQNTRAWAAYIDGTWKATDKLFVTAGVRYSRDKRYITSYYTRVLPKLPLRAAPTRATYPAWTPRFTVRYEFAPDMNVYASYSKGFKSGVFNSTAGDAAGYTVPVQPEKVNAFEVGFKAARSRYHFETAAYYYDYKDLQVTAIVQLQNPARTATALTNAATARIYGAEASLTMAVTDQLNLRMGGAYTHARYRKFPAAGTTFPVNGLNVTGTQDFSGERIARAPDWTFNLGADYTIPVGDGKIVIAANGYYTSSYAAQNEAYDPVTKKHLYYVKGYFQGNATIDWTLPNNNITLGAYVNNITDKRFRITTSANPFGTYWVLSPPRTYGVKVGYKY